MTINQLSFSMAAAQIYGVVTMRGGNCYKTEFYQFNWS